MRGSERGMRRGLPSVRVGALGGNAHGDLQPAFLLVFRFHSSAVEANRALGDGQSQARPAAFTIARGGNAIERAENFFQVGFRDAGTMVADFDGRPSIV